MNPLECYRMYMAIRLHFISKSYDYFKYNGKVKTSNESFYKRRDKYRFDTLCRQYKEKEMMHFFVANFSNGDKYGGLHTEESEGFVNTAKQCQNAAIKMFEHVFTKEKRGNRRKIRRK